MIQRGTTGTGRFTTHIVCLARCAFRRDEDSGHWLWQSRFSFNAPIEWAQNAFRIAILSKAQHNADIFANITTPLPTFSLKKSSLLKE